MHAIRELRLLVLAVTLLPLPCVGQSPYERLAATAKLWAHIKYVHPRVTAPDIDWDAAFARVAPKVLDVKTEPEFEAAIGEMLASLSDPATHVLTPSAALSTRRHVSVRTENGVLIAQFDSGPPQTQAQVAELLRQAANGPLVLDLRGSGIVLYPLYAMVPVALDSIGPSMPMRKNSGYDESLWEWHDGLHLPAAPNPIRPIFLVNSQTEIPPMALAVQNSGAGAIVSEDPITDETFVQTDTVPVLGNLRVQVRTAEVAYHDGTMGISANVVLHQTGDKALKAAVELARSSAWPSPERRRKLALPPAKFAEKNYTDQPYPAPEYRMLATARIWGVFHYFHPYQYLYSEEWDTALAEFLPRMAGARNAREYHLAVAEMVSHTHDSHCIVSSAELRQFYGTAPPGAEVRWIENSAVVTRVVDARLTASVHPGDVITHIDGKPIQERIDELQHYIAASTPQALMNRVMGILLSGPVGPGPRVTLKSEGGMQREVSFTRAADNAPLLSTRRDGEVFWLITPRFGYVDLERLTNAEVDDMLDKFKNTEAIIMDMRGYPQGTAWSIAPRLAEKPATIAAQFRRNLVTADGIQQLLFEQSIPTTDKPRYKGKTVMLIDERAISQAEHSGLFYRAANRTMFVGSPTQGAEGDVTSFMAPGGIRINFSGEDVRWPDGRQVQRVGLVPDIEVSPTIAGIQAGRDEVLERALAYLEQGR